MHLLNELTNEHSTFNVKPSNAILNTLGLNILQMLVPALTGFIIDAFSFEDIFYAMTGLYIMAVVFTSFIPVAQVAKEVSVRAGNAA
jgi:hypothetical protein